MKKNNLSLILFVVTISIAIVSYLTYKSQLVQTTFLRNKDNKQSDNESWEKYVSSYGFTIEYPSSWELESAMDPGSMGYNQTHWDIAMIFSRQETYGTTPEMAPFMMLDQLTIPPTHIKTTETSVNGYNAFVSTEWEGQFGILTYFIEKPDKKYIAVSLTPYSPDQPFRGQENYTKVFMQILSTFKFNSSR